MKKMLTLYSLLLTTLSFAAESHSPFAAHYLPSVPLVLMMVKALTPGATQFSQSLKDALVHRKDQYKECVHREVTQLQTLCPAAKDPNAENEQFLHNLQTACACRKENEDFRILFLTAAQAAMQDRYATEPRAREKMLALFGEHTTQVENEIGRKLTVSVERPPRR